MSVDEKLASEIEMNANANKVYNFFKHHISDWPNISASIQDVKVHGGDWDTHGHGSIHIWTYSIGGQTKFFKERVEYDDEKLAVTFEGLEGDVFSVYKTFTTIYEIVPKGPKHSLVVVNLNYEKLDNDSPIPNKYIDFLNGIIKDIGSHLKE